MKKKQGLLYLLERSAELLERIAEEIWISHTIAGRWPKDDKHGARRDYKELCAMAKGLREAHKYHKPNPLGGPSKMFDAIADRMRCTADYGLKFKRSNAKVSRSAPLLAQVGSTAGLGMEGKEP